MIKSTYKQFAVIHISDWSITGKAIDQFAQNAKHNLLPDNSVLSDQWNSYDKGAVFRPTGFKTTSNVTGVSYRNFKGHFADNIVNKAITVIWDRSLMSNKELESINDYLETKIETPDKNGICSRFFYVNTYVHGRGWMWGKMYLEATTEFESIEGSGFYDGNELYYLAKGSFKFIEVDGIDLNSIARTPTE